MGVLEMLRASPAWLPSQTISPLPTPHFCKTLSADSPPVLKSEPPSCHIRPVIQQTLQTLLGGSPKLKQERALTPWGQPLSKAQPGSADLLCQSQVGMGCGFSASLGPRALAHCTSI
ncbi:hypothetical protein MC885_010812 [Smutsia gigantea]|nr:hypothetical protein MC885_010812 [Smutsia gigantea]